MELDSLLARLRQAPDAELVLRPDAPPALLRGDRAEPLGPPVPAAELTALATEILGPDRQEAFDEGELVAVAWPVAGLGAFDLQLRGPWELLEIRALLELDRNTGRMEALSAVVPPEEGLPLPDALRRTLADAVAAGASDIHLGDGDPPMARIDGDLQMLAGSPVAGKPVRPLVEAMLTSVGRRRLAEGQAVDFSFSLEGVGRFRGNAYRAVKGYNLAVRSLPERIPTLDDLRLPRMLRKLVELRDGLVLFSGPTGAGKSATMAALVHHLNRTRPVHVITLEDPIEFVHNRIRAVVRQREVGVHVESFAAGLRDALREDPDVILVGEMRDLETISLAITAAETGHLVLSTLHTTRAHAAVDRIIDVFPEGRQAQIRLQLADSLRAVVTQRLLPQLGGTGRIAALEVLRVNHAVANHIREQRANQIPSVMQTHREQGMWVLERHLAALVRKELIDPEVAYAHCGDRDLFETYLRA
jgi:twitching motility protein PilT